MEEEYELDLAFDEHQWASIQEAETKFGKIRTNLFTGAIEVDGKIVSIEGLKKMLKENNEQQ